MARVWERAWSVVSTLVPSHHRDLLAIPRTAYRPIDAARWPGLLAYVEDRAVYGHPGRVVVTYNSALWEGPVRGFRHQQTRIEDGIRALQDRLAQWREHPARRGRQPTPASVEAVLPSTDPPSGTRPFSPLAMYGGPQGRAHADHPLG